MGDAWFFDWFAPVYDRLMPAADRTAVIDGLERGSIDVETVIDLAGGSGRIARELADEYDVTVFDVSRPMLQQARRHGLDGVRSDATQLSVRDEAIDGIVMADAYHHLSDPAGVLAEGVRVLRPGGVFVVRDFNPATIRGKGIEIGERLLGWPCAFRTPGGLAADLETAGFDAFVLEGGFDYTVVGVKPESDT